MRAEAKVIIFLCVIGALAPYAPADALVGQNQSSDPKAASSDKTTDTQIQETETDAEKARSIRKQIRLANISSVASSTDPNTRTALDEYIRQLDALEAPEPSVTETETAESTSTAQATGTSVDPSTQIAGSEPNLIETKQLDAREKFNKRIAELFDHPEKIVHPLAVADTLYDARDYPNAAKFYQLALERMLPNQEQPEQLEQPKQLEQPERPWALFQAGNSLRHDDKIAAAKFYEQLITEFPNSHWTPIAKVQQTIATWASTNKSDTLLEKYAGDPNSL
jgi:TolA-binding protein